MVSSIDQNRESTLLRGKQQVNVIQIDSYADVIIEYKECLQTLLSNLGLIDVCIYIYSSNSVIKSTSTV